MNDESAKPGRDQAKAIYYEALEIPAGGDRASFVQRRCGDHSKLLENVLELLRASEDLTTGGKADKFLRAEPGEQPGDRFGPYILVETIGRGAFGSVWKARQEQPFRREVALKLIHLGMETRQVLLRFEAERQVLALLEHENIARIFDAGASDQGRPWFVMELVRGPKITDYCDEHRLSTTARLLLFTQVCRALQHAHEKGIVHRDLKPSNILVSEHNGIPSPKIIDFGIAKATGQRLTEATLHTAAGQFMGTLSYMSPEQTAMDGEVVDARSDVYSLGALLFELLVGQPPVTEAEFQRMFFDEVVRTIRKQDPPRPSTKLTQTLVAASRKAGDSKSDNSGALPRRRYGHMEEAVRVLKGELDWVVLKCLEKDRQHRYQNAGELANRLQRHLENQHTAETGYRIGYWLRRHQAALGAAAIILVAFAGWWHWLKVRPSPWREVPITVAGDPKPWRRQWSKIEIGVGEGWLAGGLDEQDGEGEFLGHGLLLHTMDGGTNWHEINLTNSDAGSGTVARFMKKKWDGIGPIRDLEFSTKIHADGSRTTNVWIASISGIFMSTNALAPEARWTRVTPAPNESDGYSEFSGILSLDGEKDFYAYGWQGISHWEQGGQWQVQLGTYTYSIDGICVLDNSRPDLWAVANGGGSDKSNWGTAADFGAIYHLCGSNGTWMRVSLPSVKLLPQQGLDAIAVVPLSEDVVAVGGGGLILRSRNGAARWESFTPVKTALRSIKYDAGEGNFWVVGDRGTVLRSSDDGETWVVRPCQGLDGKPFKDSLHGIVFDERGHAWAIGDRRVLECDAP